MPQFPADLSCAGLTKALTSSRFGCLPVEKLSKPTTGWSSLSSSSRRLDPMKPATPVTSQWAEDGRRMTDDGGLWDNKTTGLRDYGTTGLRTAVAGHQMTEDR
jgi:hypothetical protein